ncbi:hypothetical protein BDF19DRAFT_415334 [Syncephalis fuscata]|nr:hypothetical protein BDF19DRAFT_415334 [Syncephalis fuscata]
MWKFLLFTYYLENPLYSPLQFFILNNQLRKFRNNAWFKIYRYFSIGAMVFLSIAHTAIAAPGLFSKKPDINHPIYGNKLFREHGIENIELSNSQEGIQYAKGTWKKQEVMITCANNDRDDWSDDIKIYKHIIDRSSVLNSQRTKDSKYTIGLVDYISVARHSCYKFGNSISMVQKVLKQVADGVRDLRKINLLYLGIPSICINDKKHAVFKQFFGSYIEGSNPEDPEDIIMTDRMKQIIELNVFELHLFMHKRTTNDEVMENMRLRNLKEKVMKTYYDLYKTKILPNYHYAPQNKLLMAGNDQVYNQSVQLFF